MTRSELPRPVLRTPDPKLDLVLERVIDVPKNLVWAAWTVPDHVVKWLTPAPWKTIACEIDLRPGGIFSFTMRSPEGKDFPYVGCWLDVVPEERLIWTMALGPGFRPSPVKHDVPAFTAIISLESQGKGTRYTAVAMHSDEAGRGKHAQMGFHEGWGAALDQLVAAFAPR